nr:type I restriction enzyme HsdR N-terminal domain-containing protein [Aquabacterium sp. A08]
MSNRIKRQRDHVKTEEAVKTAFILPFIQALGYDVFNPAEVIPEHTADHGVKKGEKVDYAIKLDNKIMILIECKQVDAPLEAKHAGQLFRYFTVTEARFGVLTDGARYLFYTDLEAPNKMDERPFFEFNLLDFNEAAVNELKKFSKPGFDVETIVSTASNLKYLRALLTEIRNEFASPSEDLVRLLVSRVLPGARFTAQVKEQYTELTRRALEAFMNDSINLRLKSAMTDAPAVVTPTSAPASATPNEVTQDASSDDREIITTEEEVAAHRIIQAIGSEIVDPEDIVMRDAKSYCAILYKDNNRRPIARLYFNRKKALQVGIFIEDGETKHDIERLTDLFKHKASVLASIQQYLPKDK